MAARVTPALPHLRLTLQLIGDALERRWLCLEWEPVGTIAHLIKHWSSAPAIRDANQRSPH